MNRLPTDREVQFLVTGALAGLLTGLIGGYSFFTILHAVASTL